MPAEATWGCNQFWSSVRAEIASNQWAISSPLFCFLATFIHLICVYICAEMQFKVCTWGVTGHLWELVLLCELLSDQSMVARSLLTHLNSLFFYFIFFKHGLMWPRHTSHLPCSKDDLEFLILLCLPFKCWVTGSKLKYGILISRLPSVPMMRLGQGLVTNF